jgi:hypothetical protein
MLLLVVEVPCVTSSLLLLLACGLLAVSLKLLLRLLLLLVVHPQDQSLLLLLLLPLLVAVVVQVVRSRNWSLAAAAPAEHTRRMQCSSALGPGSTDPVSCHNTSSTSGADSAPGVDGTRTVLWHPAWGQAGGGR